MGGPSVRVLNCSALAWVSGRLEFFMADSWEYLIAVPGREGFLGDPVERLREPGRIGRAVPHRVAHGDRMR